MKYLLFFIFLVQCLISNSQQKEIRVVENNKYLISWPKGDVTALTYTLKGSKKNLNISFPEFEINGEKMPTVLERLKITKAGMLLSNGCSEFELSGKFINNPSITLTVILQIPIDNSVLRFKYCLSDSKNLKLTKKSGFDNITYLTFSNTSSSIKEIRISEFNHRLHANHRTEYILDDRFIENEGSFMGPIAVFQETENTFLVAYEHGSQFPDRFLEFSLNKNKTVAIVSKKANYLTNQLVNGFSSVWFQFAGTTGGEDELSNEYRNFILNHMTQNGESRKPYIFYNTWGRQERVQWRGDKYLSSMNLKWTLDEIDKAHSMGIEVFVIDAGWFIKTGDWEVNRDFFPDDLKEVRSRLKSYGMKLGLWFNPTVAAVTSDMYQKNLANLMSMDGTYREPYEIWETEKSVNMCLVSPYWEDFAEVLIRLTKELGVSYFKWDAIGQYGCNDSNHLHGTEEHSAEERTQRYAFLQPEYMAKIVDRVCKVAPQVIFDFDITEDGRCVGLQFLSVGKYFIINNGPYYHNFDLVPEWKSVLPSGNPNIFVQPGPARGWFVRSILDYDKWIPSVLFLTHYQPDEPRNSQIINLGSLILGQNGVWGEILKTSDQGVLLFDSVLTKYKQIRNDITQAKMVMTGEPGGSPEIYEKINPITGKGCVVIFANEKGKHSYITASKVNPSYWHNEQVEIRFDKVGRGIIDVEFTSPSAKIIFFGVK